jgi:hypothetical protein
MKNGSIEFVAVMAEKFKAYVKPFVTYELVIDFQDQGFPVREISKRITELCNDKNKLKEERAKAKDLKQKIVGTQCDDYNRNSYSSVLGKNEIGVYNSDNVHMIKDILGDVKKRKIDDEDQESEEEN